MVLFSPTPSPVAYLISSGSHFQVGILGNAADFVEDGASGSTPDNNLKRRQMMIAFDMRYSH